MYSLTRFIGQNHMTQGNMTLVDALCYACNFARRSDSIVIKRPSGAACFEFTPACITFVKSWVKQLPR